MNIRLWITEVFFINIEMSESEAKGQRPGGKGQGAEAGVAEATVCLKGGGII